ncbi:D12 class N6 adenine-specific DNA methyltransferase family protein (plasmid) [Helicobacter sp. NHP19-012]|uniref:site-specific DNA-methyltransferase (adenine-specific) n=1 Tax=Helicobacter gastrofelis TaxID=2849642 RepID=A0ABM7SJE8_9HELI|nr:MULTISPECIES: DNA adenine methylase [unclassified Helicobacter]BCZ20049.1 D12 class N6 adenine-specific DNA methyltransferase family protein [Helicobacter sp. NHP19-012]GMB96943.1 D12 class N6 adenine-specific DNA methyltransferase family protein [Helicobacter sp. NHP22-001]
MASPCFNIANRRYTGAKTKILNEIGAVIASIPSLEKQKNKVFFDVFAGTGVVSEFFIRQNSFTHFILNDFLHANHAIYQAFLSQEPFNQALLNSLHDRYNALDHLEDNYYSKHFGGKFFSLLDAQKIGFIRSDIDRLRHTHAITQKEFYILLASLLFSVDKIANTVGHYDAYRKNTPPQDRFKFVPIQPIQTPHIIDIRQMDANTLAKNLDIPIAIAFIDPPYNSRQYSRFYHLLETLAKNNQPKLYGQALKPQPENMSAYCKVEAKIAFKNLVQALAPKTKALVVTYNNTYTSKSNSSQNKITLQEISTILQSCGKLTTHEFPFKAFSAGKTEFEAHKEYIFVCEVK